MTSADLSTHELLAVIDLVNNGGLSRTKRGWVAAAPLFRATHLPATMRALKARGLCKRTDNGFEPTDAANALVAAYCDKTFNEFFEPGAHAGSRG